MAGRSHVADVPRDSPWPLVFELAAATPPGSWVLVGGLMVHLHALRAGIEATRPTSDVDVLLDISSNTVLDVVGPLTSLGFSARDPSRGAPLHRFVRDERDVVDVMVARDVRSRTQWQLRPLPRSTSPAKALRRRNLAKGATLRQRPHTGTCACDISRNILSAMVALTPAILEALGDVVIDVREGYEAGVWAVGEALALHDAFTDTNVPRSSLVRAIIVREFRAAAARQGLYARSGQGGAVELYELNGDEYAVIRLRGAEIVAGELRVIANSGSTWGGLSDDGFWREIPYVLGCIVGDGASLNFFVAEVVGQTDAAVAHLEFGWTHHFPPSGPPDETSFKPNDEDSLDGWDKPSVREAQIEL